MTRVRLLVRPGLRRPGALLLPSWLAITLGHTIVSWRPLDRAELAHELEHVRQWERFGTIDFAMRYLAASAAALAAGGHWYRDNRFELEAAEAARRARTR